MKDRLREALVEITKLDCSFDMWPRSAAVEIAEAALASQPSGQPVTSAPSPIWPESPCRVCGKPTIDEGGYCSDECLEKSEPIKSPSDLRAKLESLRDWMGEQMKGRPWTAGSHFDEAHKRLTAIIEGKD